MQYIIIIIIIIIIVGVRTYVRKGTVLSGSRTKMPCARVRTRTRACYIYAAQRARVRVLRTYVRMYVP